LLHLLTGGVFVNYERQRAELERLLAHLVRRTEAVGRDLRRASGPLNPDFAEQGVELANDEVLEQLARAGPPQITMIRRALDRIENGTYETCVLCGGAIAVRRLEALPYALTCVACSEHREAAGSQGRNG
jgi:RNA polymerase-binding transcription factor DksA